GGGRAGRDERGSRAGEADGGRAGAARGGRKMRGTGSGRGATGGAAPAPRPRSMRASRVGTSPRRPQARARTCGVACAAPPVPPPRETRNRLLLFLVALAIAYPVTARAADVKLPPVTRVTLENGLRLIVAELHEVPLVEFYVMVGAGSAEDPEGKEGLTPLSPDVLTPGAGE